MTQNDSRAPLRKRERDFWRGFNAAIDHTRATLAEAPEHLPLEEHGRRAIAALDYLFGESYHNLERLKTCSAATATLFRCAQLKLSRA